MQKRYSVLIASTKQVHDSVEFLIDYLDDARVDEIIILDGGLNLVVVATLEKTSQNCNILYACK